MNISDYMLQIKKIRAELEDRHDTGIVKVGSDGKVESTGDMQARMYALIYKLSRLIKEQSST